MPPSTFQFSPRESQILIAFARAVLAVPSGNFPDVTEIDLPNRVAHHLNFLSAALRWFYRRALWLFELGGYCSRTARWRPFTKLSRKRQQAYLRMWQYSWWLPKKVVRRFLESLIELIYYADPRVAAACGWQAPTGRPAAPMSLPFEQVLRGPTRQQRGELRISAEIVVIGSGAGGAVVAETLASLGHEVVILEEGDVIDASQFRGDIMTATEAMYRDAGTTVTYGWPLILVPYGRVVGGTTVINSGTMLRPADALFARWGEYFRLADWSARAMAQHFDAAEAMLHVAPVAPAVQGPHATIFARGAQSLGVSVEPLPRNAPNCLGSGLCCFGCPTNAKLSMALTYLPRALQHGARLYANAHVERILHRQGEAVAVQGRWGNPNVSDPTQHTIPFTIRARQIVVCAGTLQTPRILWRSGIEHPHLGNHLTLHPAIKVFAEMPEPVDSWRGVPQGMYSDGLHHIGATLESIFIPPAYTAISVMTTGEAHRRAMERYRHLVGFGAMLADRSEGRLLHFSGDRVLPYYRVSGQDLRRYQETLTFLTEVFFAAGAVRVYPACHRWPVLERAEGTQPLRDKHLRRIDLDLQAFHPLGTCRMAGDPEEGVLNPDGRLYTMQNLYVADGSIFPTPLGVNPQLTIMAAARKIALGMHQR